MVPELLIPRRRPRGLFPVDDEDRVDGVDRAPITATPALPAPRPVVTDPAPVPIRPAHPLPTEPSIDPGAPPLTINGRRGRPALVPSLPQADTLNAEQQLMERLRTYEPQKRSRLRLIGMSALRGLAAGPGGAVTGALWGGLASVVDPTIEDRVWRDREMARSTQAQGDIRAQQRDELNDELLRARVEETRAQADQRKRPVRPVYGKEVLDDGTTIATQVNSDTGLPEPVLRDGQPVVLGRPKPRVSVSVPNVGEIEATPEAALGYYGQVDARGQQRQERETKRAEDEVARTARREAKVSESQSFYHKADAAEANAAALDQHIRKLEAGMATMPEGPVSMSEPEQYEDPATKEIRTRNVTRSYSSGRATFERQINELKDQQRQLRNQAAGWRVDGDRARAEAESIPASSRTAPPPPAGVSEASIRAEARRRGANEDAAVQRARELKWIP